MSVLALFHASNLIGNELRQSLGRRPKLRQEVRLLTTDSKEAGALTEIRGNAAMVLEADEHNLAGIDVAFLCGTMAQSRPLIERLLPTTAVVLLSADAGPEDGLPIVAGINVDQVIASEPIVSPHPGTIALAHLLQPLLRYRPRQVVATLLQPISSYGPEALDEMLEQTRRLLTFQPQEHNNLPTQVAFNLLKSAPPPHTARHLGTILSTDLEAVSIQLLQAGTFHNFAVSLNIQLEEDPGAEAVRQALGEHPLNELAEDVELLGSIDAAGRDEVLVGSVEPVPGQSGSYWIWAVMDNITCGGVLNALAILEVLRRSEVVH